MTEVHILPNRISPEGAHRLLAALQDDFASGRDLGPRGAQIQALGFSLEHAGRDLRCEVDRITAGLPTKDSSLSAACAEVLRWCEELSCLADAFVRFGVRARSYDPKLLEF